MSAEDLEIISARAKRLYRGNISAVIHDLVAALRREEAATELLEMLDGERITNDEIQAIRDEVAAAPPPRRKRRPAA